VSYSLPGRGPARRWNGHRHMPDLSTAGLRRRMLATAAPSAAPRPAGGAHSHLASPRHNHHHPYCLARRTRPEPGSRSQTEGYRLCRGDPGTKGWRPRRAAQGAWTGSKKPRGEKREGRGLPERWEWGCAPPCCDLAAPGRHLAAAAWLPPVSPPRSTPASRCRARRRRSLASLCRRNRSFPRVGDGD
jgi:hypothetical protein